MAHYEQRTSELGPAKRETENSQVNQVLQHPDSPRLTVTENFTQTFTETLTINTLKEDGENDEEAQQLPLARALKQIQPSNSIEKLPPIN